MTDLLTVRQAATKLGITRQAVQQLIESKRLHAIWMLERWAIPASEVSRYKHQKSEKLKLKQSEAAA